SNSAESQLTLVAAQLPTDQFAEANCRAARIASRPLSLVGKYHIHNAVRTLLPEAASSPSNRGNKRRVVRDRRYLGQHRAPVPVVRSNQASCPARPVARSGRAIDL